MQNKTSIIALLGFVVLLSAVFYSLFTRNTANSSTSLIQQKRTITVYGTAKQNNKNTLASFSLQVEGKDADKTKAANDAAQSMTTIVSWLKTNGIAEEDLKTSRVSERQEQIPYQDTKGVYLTRPGDWIVSSSLEITIRDTNKVESIQTYLVNSEAKNVNGPNFRQDDTKTANHDLLTLAVADAQAKAEKIAKAQKIHIGKILSITEGFSYTPYQGYDLVNTATSMMGMEKTTMPAQEGSSLESATATVVFEIK
ncbi:MAG: SIMPL domain-containing protein [Candidatus Roizmanbacteria bacterium]|nr:SIMPL domain-containing protein [Candidatus Roizmanbacteria bacterium]